MILSAYIEKDNSRAAVSRDNEIIFVIFRTYKIKGANITDVFEIIPTERKYFKLLYKKKYQGYLERVLKALKEYQDLLNAADQKHEEITESLKITVK